MPERLSASERLLTTASHLFAREGIRSVGIDRILAEANVAKATLYQGFGSKEALVVAHIERRDMLDRRAYRAEVAGLPLRGHERVLASFELAARSAEAADYPGCVYANALNEFSDPEQPIARAVHQHRDWLRGEWEAALEEHDDAALLAAEATIIYDGALLGSRVARSSEPILLGRQLAYARIRHDQ
ncbi:TetR/AcrR family transcriptional regulator [Leucobacter sp. GX24907]